MVTPVSKTKYTYYFEITRYKTLQNQCRHPLYPCNPSLWIRKSPLSHCRPRHFSFGTARRALMAKRKVGTGQAHVEGAGVAGLRLGRIECGVHYYRDTNFGGHYRGIILRMPRSRTGRPCRLPRGDQGCCSSLHRCLNRRHAIQLTAADQTYHDHSCVSATR